MKRYLAVTVYNSDGKQWYDNAVRLSHVLLVVAENKYCESTYTNLLLVLNSPKLCTVSGLDFDQPTRIALLCKRAAIPTSHSAATCFKLKNTW